MLGGRGSSVGVWAGEGNVIALKQSYQFASFTYPVAFILQAYKSKLR